MAVLFKKESWADLTKQDAPKLYYPRLITLGQTVSVDVVAWKIKERSSLSKGEVLSVLTNFVEVMRECLFAGQSVNIANFGVFSLSCTADGSELAKDCTAEKIKQVNINFRPSTSVKIDPTSTRAGDKMEFIDLQTYLDSLKGAGGGTDDGGGGVVDPTA